MSETKLRFLHFETLPEAVAEAERLASIPVVTTGNYTLGQILEHLARTLDIVCGHTKIPFKPNFVVRTLARLMRSRILNGPPKPGFKLPPKVQPIFWPESDVPVDQAITHFRDAYHRYEAAKPLPKHLFFGDLSQQQHDQLQCRHCELHLGFVKPADQ